MANRGLPAMVLEDTVLPYCNLHPKAAQWGQAPIAETDVLSSVPGPHVEEGENHFPQIVL